MYSRTYYPDGQERIALPENYDGTAFTEQAPIPDVEEVTPTVADVQEKPPDGGDSIMTSLGRLPFLSGIFGKGGLFGDGNLKFPKIGTEEILILATAAFLFFSKNGDRESALILLFLLLIN